jgi:hypothetical protein
VGVLSEAETGFKHFCKFSESVPSALIKELGYQHQREARGVWIARHPEAITPMIVHVKKAARVCRALSV